MLVTGIALFVLLVLTVIGFSYCANYKEKSERLSEGLKTSNEENANLVKQIKSLKAQLDKVSSELKAKTTEAQMLETALADLRKQVGKVAAEKQKAEQEKLSLEALKSSLEKELESKEIKITELQGKLTVNLVDKVLFDSGRAEIKASGRKVLDKIAKNLLNKYPDRAVLVAGYTDNVPIGDDLKSRFPTNWELSTERATAAVRYLQEHGGVDPKRLSAIGYAQYHPIADNNTEEGRAKNRRVEIIFYR